MTQLLMSADVVFQYFQLLMSPYFKEHLQQTTMCHTTRSMSRFNRFHNKRHRRCFYDLTLPLVYDLEPV